jgi:hypothetical protein
MTVLPARAPSAPHDTAQETSIMIGSTTNRATEAVLVTTVAALLLAGCSSAKPSPSSAAAGSNPAATAAAPSSAANPASVPAPTTVAAKGGTTGLTACELVTDKEASTAIGSPVGPGTAGGSAALSECIYGDGALIIGMKTDSKELFDTSRAAALSKGATDLPGVGDSAFQAGAGQSFTLEFLKGTTLVSILFGGGGAAGAAVAVAKAAAAKM